MRLPSWSSHCSSADKIVSLRDSLAVSSSCFVFVFWDSLARPFLRTSRGLRVMGCGIGRQIIFSPTLTSLLSPVMDQQYMSSCQFTSAEIHNIIKFIVRNLLKPIDFACKGVWGMGYCGPQGYGINFPAHQVGGSKILWDIRGYGLSQVWVMRMVTVESWLEIRIPGEIGKFSVTLDTLNT